MLPPSSAPCARLLCLAGFAVCWLLVAAPRLLAEEPREAVDYFEREVRPILFDTCVKCHGATKQESDLRLDSREALLKGGLSGPAIEPGRPEKSLLVAAIRHEGDIKMPPKAKLTEAQIAAVAHWVKLGAPWPKEAAGGSSNAEKARTHWAFQPVKDPKPPEGGMPIDAFIRAKLAAEGLAHSPPADRRTLLRRASYDLTGLPPTPEESETFERDTDPKAYENAVERLLASPHYGEHWGRHWLDVARYSDTKGYVYGREQRMWVHAWVYRDWVVKALNEDMPYDRFLLLQIAADQATDQKEDRAAMGFLTLGRRFLGVTRDIIDDRIDVLTRGTMGLTVACARCHDHKYDPIPTQDYYSLYGVFQNSSERIVPVAEPAAGDDSAAKYMTELAARRKKLADMLATRRRETADRVRARAGDYLAAQLELHKYPPEGFDQIFAKTDMLPMFAHRWQSYLADAEKRGDPVFAAWHAFADLPPREFAAKAAETTKTLAALPPEKLNPLVAAKFATPPASMTDVATRYGDLFTAIERQWRDISTRSVSEEGKAAAPTSLPDPAAEALRQVLYAPLGPCEMPDEPIVNIEYYLDSDSLNELWKLQNELDQWILQSPPSMRHAIVLEDRTWTTTNRVFKRGNPANPGEQVQRHFVSVLDREGKPFEHGSGRLELARAIIDPQNPLTARVIVNRVWMHHFGAGLVATPSDFGTRAAPPSHPELLDWLVCRFIEEGWSLKKLHRRIMLSETYRQDSRGPVDAPQLAKARERDPANRLLWRFSDRRLAFEELRDSLLAASGRFDSAVGGRAGDLFAPGFTRRSLYGTIDRQFLPSTLRVFDFANPDLHIPQRAETTVPQQALFFLNHPLMVDFAKSLAARTASAGSDDARIRQMFRLAYQRNATPTEIAGALELVAAGADQPAAAPATAADWQYGFGGFDEKTQRVTGFTKLPHFTGSAWQGGPNFPDPKLGYAQLSAAGGHPGNDLAHAAIRRWTAPRDLKVKVQSTLIHEPAEGEGVRGLLVSSRAGLLKQVAVHHGRADLSADTLDLKAGDTLDFLADIGTKLSYNQFLWKATITPLEPAGPAWESERDFGGRDAKQLDPWEQLAQVILSANEFVFVD